MKGVYEDRSTAARYDAARTLPPETMALWLDAIRASLPPDHRVRAVLDLGCGTGRFSRGLAERFACPVIGVDPSAAMLAVARSGETAGIAWVQGAGEAVPIDDGAVDLVFLSQVFHHLRDPDVTIREIGRALAPGGYLVIRNAVSENNEAIPWLQCFPEALAIERARILPRRELVGRVCAGAFERISQRTVLQKFADSPQEYFEKVRQRGLSSLLAIDDQAFERGLQRFQEWVARRPPDEPVYDPVDLLTFRRLPLR